MIVIVIATTIAIIITTTTPTTNIGTIVTRFQSLCCLGTAQIPWLLRPKTIVIVTIAIIVAVVAVLVVFVDTEYPSRAAIIP